MTPNYRPRLMLPSRLSGIPKAGTVMLPLPKSCRTCAVFKPAGILRMIGGWSVICFHRPPAPHSLLFPSLPETRVFLRTSRFSGDTSAALPPLPAPV